MPGRFYHAKGGRMTVAEYVEILKKLPQDRIVCFGSNDGVYLVCGKAELKSGRWQEGDDYIHLEYEPVSDDPEDDALFGPRREVVVLR